MSITNVEYNDGSGIYRIINKAKRNLRKFCRDNSAGNAGNFMQFVKGFRKYCLGWRII